MLLKDQPPWLVICTPYATKNKDPIKGEKWTAEKNRQLIRMHRKKYTVPEIAASIGRTKYAVKSRIQVLRRRGVL